MNDLNSEEEDEEDTANNFFTGGEKSGLQVEDPNDGKDDNERSLIEQIFRRAREQMGTEDERPSARAAQPKPASHFKGGGFKLGGVDEPSEKVEGEPDPTANILPKVNREITFWRQGFTVGESSLYRYDDPANARILQELNAGRVPTSLLDVEFGQDVDVSVFRKTDEDWVPPKKKAGGFSGQGQRLGSPVPGEPMGAVPMPTDTQNKEKDTRPDTGGEGDSLVQIRFANGQRVAHKFNSTDSVRLVYNFVRDHPFSSPDRQFMLSQSFPVKPIEDSENITVQDAKLKNAVIIQRWI